MSDLVGSQKEEGMNTYASVNEVGYYLSNEQRGKVKILWLKNVTLVLKIFPLVSEF